MKSKKLLLTIKDLKDLGLIGKRKKKSRRKRKADKKLGANSVISGVRSEFIGPTFGTQINRTTDLQNENIRLQNEKLLDNIKNSENQSRTLLQLTDATTANRQAITDADTTNRRAIQEIYTYGNRLQTQQNDMLTMLQRTANLPLPLKNDGIDAPTTTGEGDTMGNPKKKEGSRDNENDLMYNLQNANNINSLGGGASVPVRSQLKREKSIEKIVGDVSVTPSENEDEEYEEDDAEFIDEYISQMSTRQLQYLYKQRGGKSDLSNLKKSELRKTVTLLVEPLSTRSKKLSKHKVKYSVPKY